MKFFLPFLLLLSADTIAQKTTNKYNIKIDKTNKAFIKNSTVSIAKADSVIIIYQTLRTKILLSNILVEKDTNAVYHYTYIFKPTDSSLSFNYNIQIKFDKPVINDNSLYMNSFAPLGAGTMQGNFGYDEKENVVFSNGSVNSSVSGLTVSVKSKEILTATIYGVDGKIN